MRPLLIRVPTFLLWILPLLNDQRWYPIVLQLIQLWRWSLDAALTAHLGIGLVLHVDEALRLLLVRSASESDVYVLVLDCQPAIFIDVGLRVLVICACVGVWISWESHVTCEAIIFIDSLLQVTYLFLVDHCAPVELFILWQLSDSWSALLDDLRSNLTGTSSNSSRVLLVSTWILKLVILNLESSKVMRHLPITACIVL